MIQDWMLNIRTGDILLEHGTKPRVVREFSKYFKYGYWHVHVTFTIKRRSWTNRCYTILNNEDLCQRKFVPSYYRKVNMSYIDKKINFNIKSMKITLRANDVIGVI